MDRKKFDKLLLLLEKLTLEFTIIVVTKTFQMSNIEIFKIDGYQTSYN